MSTVYDDIEAIKHTVRKVASALPSPNALPSPLQHAQRLILMDVLTALDALRQRIIKERKES